MERPFPFPTHSLAMGHQSFKTCQFEAVHEYTAAQANEVWSLDNKCHLAAWRLQSSASADDPPDLATRLRPSPAQYARTEVFGDNLRPSEHHTYQRVSPHKAQYIEVTEWHSLLTQTISMCALYKWPLDLFLVQNLQLDAFALSHEHCSRPWILPVCNSHAGMYRSLFYETSSSR